MVCVIKKYKWHQKYKCQKKCQILGVAAGVGGEA
jgi:hypothetical protein